MLPPRIHLLNPNHAVIFASKALTSPVNSAFETFQINPLLCPQPLQPPWPESPTSTLNTRNKFVLDREVSDL